MVHTPLAWKHFFIYRPEKQGAWIKANEIRKMSAAELDAKLVELKKNLFMLRMQHATNQLDNPLQIAVVKKDIARIKTIIRENETKN